MLKLVFVAPKFRLRQVQKNEKKEQKMKNRVLQKKLCYFCVSGGQCGSEKSCGEGVLAKIFF